jgi:hypothetical protein
MKDYNKGKETKLVSSQEDISALSLSTKPLANIIGNHKNAIVNTISLLPLARMIGEKLGSKALESLH